MPQPTVKITPPEDEDKNDIYEEDLGLANNANGNSIQSIPALWGVPLKYISLVTLAVQNSLLTIIMHYSRVSMPSSRAYSAATAVLMNELLKGSISFAIAFLRIEHRPTAFSLDDAPVRQSQIHPAVIFYRLRRLGIAIFSPDCWKLSIPAILYVIQNNLQFVAASNLDAATFQVTYQMKILTTAAFSVMLLRKKLSPAQWLSLLFLAIGVGIVQIQTGEAKGVASFDLHSMNKIKGFMAVTAACFTSGLAGVYFEMVLKNSPGDLWVRNIQLSLFSILPAITPILFSQDNNAVLGSSQWFAELFRNFGPWAWATVLVQVLGGLLTAMVIKYSDNILKGFATSLSIVISFLTSVALFNFQMTFTFVLGSAIVLNATWLYNQQPKRLDTTLIRAWSWNEKSRTLGGIRSPAIEKDKSAMAVVLSSSSRTSSMVSLLSNGSP